MAVSINMTVKNCLGRIFFMFLFIFRCLICTCLLTYAYDKWAFPLPVIFYLSPENLFKLIVHFIIEIFTGNVVQILSQEKMKLKKVDTKSCKVFSITQKTRKNTTYFHR